MCAFAPAFTHGCGAGSLAQREASRAPAAPAAPVPNRCYPDGRPDPIAGVAASSEPSTSCHSFARAKVTNTEASLRRSYQPIYGDSKVIVDFQCDPVEQPNRIDLELADERSGQLRLLRFTRPPEGGDFHVLGVELHAPEPGGQAPDDRTLDRFAVKSAQLVVTAAALDLEDVRTPLMATINEVQFSDQLPAVQGFTGPQIHRVVRVSGRDRHLVRGPDGLEQALRFTPARFERRYTGEAESIAQKHYLPLDLAAAPLLAVVPAAAFGTTVNEEHRELAWASFSASFEGSPDWLRRFYLGVAGRLGSARMIPALVRVAQEGPGAERVLAVNALAAITGWDARFEAGGTPRPIDAVAADYARECGAPSAAK